MRGGKRKRVGTDGGELKHLKNEKKKELARNGKRDKNREKKRKWINTERERKRVETDGREFIKTSQKQKEEDEIEVGKINENTDKEKR